MRPVRPLWCGLRRRAGLARSKLLAHPPRFSDNQTVDAIDLGLIKRLARAALKAEDCYAYCRLVPILAEAVGPGAPASEWALGYLRALAKLGLNAAAQQLIEGPLAPALDDETFRRLAETLRSAASGRIAWTSRRPCFSANLKALAARDRELARAVEENWKESAERFELHRCADGVFQVRQSGPAWPPSWFLRLDDHTADLEERVNTKTGGFMPPPMIFEGVGLGYEVLDGYRRTNKVFLEASSALYVIEPRLESVAIAMHLHDWREALSDSRFMLFAGPEATKRFAQTFLDDAHLPFPVYQVCLHSWAPEYGPSVGDLLNQTGNGRNEARLALTAQVDQIYGNRDAAYWARRYETADRQDPLRVMFFVSRHTTYLKYCIRDLAASFERQAVKTCILTEKADYCLLPASVQLRAIRDFRPDLLFIIDHLRHEYPGIVPNNVPNVAWIQDQLPHLFRRESGESLGPLDFYIAPNGLGSLGQFGYPHSQGMTWTAVTDARQYSHEPLPEAVLAPHACDFSYVGHQSRPPEALRDEWRQRVKDNAPARRMVDRVHEVLEQSLIENPRAACGHRDWVLEEIEQTTGEAINEQVRYMLGRFYVYQLAELMLRQGTLQWVADYCDRTGRTLHLYGRGWEDHPRFAEYARGVAENGDQLRAIYQASRINLQIVGTGAIHQRLLDGLAAGGFFLIRQTPGDTYHAPAARLLAAIRKTGFQGDTLYRCEEMPEVAEAWRQARRHLGGSFNAQAFMLPNSGIQRMEELEPHGDRQLAALLFSRYEDVAFGTRNEFECLADRYLDAAAERAALATSMRAAIIDRFTYGGLVEELLRFIRRRLTETAACASSC